MQGFIRTAILEANCFDVRLYSKGKCTSCQNHGDCSLNETIGSPSEKDRPGKLTLRGPFLVHSDGELIRRIYVAPRDLVYHKDDNGNVVYLRIAPGDQIECDLGKVQLPAFCDGMNACDWITETGLESYLAGDMPPQKEIISGHNDEAETNEVSLWDTTPKVGIARDRLTHVAREHMLYSIEMMRLRPGVSLAVRVGGLDDKLESKVKGIYRLGGEGCLASISMQNETSLPVPPNLIDSINRSGRFRLITLQPADLDGSWLPPGFKAVQRNGITVWEGSLKGIPLDLLSACLAKPERIGGWDIAAASPAPVKSCVHPGAVYYFQAKPGLGSKIVELFHDKGIGKRDAFGFGHVVVGCWNEQNS
jgi:CRISPR-associated protein Cmr3